MNALTSSDFERYVKESKSEYEKQSRWERYFQGLDEQQEQATSQIETQRDINVDSAYKNYLQRQEGMEDTGVALERERQGVGSALNQQFSTQVSGIDDASREAFSEVLENYQAQRQEGQEQIAEEGDILSSIYKQARNYATDELDMDVNSTELFETVTDEDGNLQYKQPTPKLRNLMDRALNKMALNDEGEPMQQFGDYLIETAGEETYDYLMNQGATKLRDMFNLGMEYDEELEGEAALQDLDPELYDRDALDGNVMNEILRGEYTINLDTEKKDVEIPTIGKGYYEAIQTEGTVADDIPFKVKRRVTQSKGSMYSLGRGELHTDLNDYVEENPNLDYKDGLVFERDGTLYVMNRTDFGDDDFRWHRWEYYELESDKNE